MTEPHPELDSFEGSPDAPKPVTPELLDFASEEDLLQLSIEYAQAALPEWEPRAGNTEVVLMESLAQMVTVLAFAVQQAPGELLSRLLRLYGVNRDSGAPTRAVAEFEVSGSHPIYEVPAGTVVRATIESTGETVDFSTSGRLEIITGDGHTGTQTVVAEENGAQFNRIPSGTSLTMVDNLPFVERVHLTTDTSGGRDEESDAAFESRAAALLSRLVSTLVLPEHFQQAALELADVGRALPHDLHDPSQPDEDEAPGHITVYVTDTDGQPLEATQGQEVKDALQEQAMAALIVHVEDPDYTDLTVDVEVRAADDADPELIQDRVEERLRRWLSPARWPWGGRVSQFAIVSEVSQVDGVAAVVSASPDQDLDGHAPLPNLETLTVTVTEGS